MKLNHLFAAVCCGLLAVSCQEEELGFSQEEVFRGAYGRNFEKKFGAIDPNQSWDFSSDATRVTGTGGIEYVTVADTVGENKGYYVVDKNTLAWMNEKLPESKNNRGVTRAFSLTWHEGCIFEIIPIYQGKAGMVWDFYISVNGKEHKIWSKGTNLQKKATESSDWTTLGTSVNDVTIDAAAVRAQPILIDPVYTKECKPGDEVYFYLKITTGQSNYADKDKEQTSKAGMICMLDCPTPANIAAINPDYDSYILGCEDANLSSSDYDYNDIVFLVTGYVPDPIYDGEKETIEHQKRYMVEDLSSVADFDFNDIVVDVKQIKTTYYYHPDGDETTWVVNPDKPATTRQEATLRWICGTIPFQVQVGETCFGWVSDPMNQKQTAIELMKDAQPTDYTVPADYEYTPVKNNGYQPLQEGNKLTGNRPCTKLITGWVPERNNIQVRVCWDKTTSSTAGTTWTNTFPVEGTVPFMVATDITPENNWTKEHEDITETDWWKEGYIATHQQ